MNSVRRLLKYAAIGFLSLFVLTTGLGMVATAQDEEAPSQEAVAEVDGDEAEAAAATDDRIELSNRSAETPILLRVQSFFGMFGLLLIAFLFSNNRKAIDWRLVAVGTSIQLLFALLILKSPFGAVVFGTASEIFTKLLGFTNAGNAMIFSSYVTGEIDASLINFAFNVLPTIVFFSALMTILYHLGVMQAVVNVIARAMQATMRTSGAETLSAAGNIFVGQTEAPLLVKPFVATMTKSELMAVMTGGFATVAGGVMALYIGFLEPHFADIAGHLMAASVMSAPAALVVAKIMYPETEESPTKGVVKVEVEKIDANVIDAASRGASEGLQLAFNVAAMLLTFVALIAMINYMMALPSYVQHGMALEQLATEISEGESEVPTEVRMTCDPTFRYDRCVANPAICEDFVASATCGDGNRDLGEECDDGNTVSGDRCSASCLTEQGVRVGPEEREGCIAALTGAVPNPPTVSVMTVFDLQFFFGWLFAPIAFLMGVPWMDLRAVGELLGTKMVVNEFVAYLDLAGVMNSDSPLQPRSAIIVTYALCGFANFGSIGIQIGGISGLAPERRSDLATLGLRAMIGGSLAAFMTATIAGLLI
jgi:CNT family concentrative nucleoside transporter